ncbi:MAG: hypothetical protein II276_01630, partial [Bacteroidales bacterium]|nr:hypothetical protein [Bacteroidales bacterium]
GIKADGFWSENNETHEMWEEEKRVRKSVIENEVIPDDVRVLLINAASETGINIKSPVDYVVVNDSNPDTQAQAIGRVRHDLETVYLRDKGAEERRFIDRTCVEEWFNRRLYAEEKEILSEELCLCDNRGRLLKWTNVKKALQESGFAVIDKREKSGKRYSVIQG